MNVNNVHYWLLLISHKYQHTPKKVVQRTGCNLHKYMVDGECSSQVATISTKQQKYIMQNYQTSFILQFTADKVWLQDLLS